MKRTDLETFFFFIAFPYGGVTMGLGLRMLSGDSASLRAALR